MPGAGQSRTDNGAVGERVSRPTLEDVAASAGVSRASASRALLGQRKVSSETVEKVRAAAARLGYVPNVAARQLAAGVPHAAMVGLIVRDGANPVYAKLAHHLQDGMRDHGQQLITMSLSNQLAGEIAPTVLDSMLGLGVTGLIVASGKVTSELLQAHLPGPVSIIRCGSPETSGRIPSVSYDEEEHGRMVAEFLTGHGHREVAIVAFTEHESLPQHIRANAMATEFARAGVRYHRIDDGDRATRIARAIELVGHGVTAIACADDGWAVATLRALDAAGLAVPGDVSVMGVDGAMEGIDLIGLTTLRLPVAAVAKQAIETLADLQRGTVAHTPRVLLHGEILDQGSVGPPRTAAATASQTD